MSEIRIGGTHLCHHGTMATLCPLCPLEAQLARAERVIRQIADMAGEEGIDDHMFARRVLKRIAAYDTANPSTNGEGETG